MVILYTISSLYSSLFKYGSLLVRGFVVTRVHKFRLVEVLFSLRGSPLYAARRPRRALPAAEAAPGPQERRLARRLARRASVAAPIALCVRRRLDACTDDVPEPRHHGQLWVPRALPGVRPVSKSVSS